jgi:hypothetical protein
VKNSFQLLDVSFLSINKQLTAFENTRTLSAPSNSPEEKNPGTLEPFFFSNETGKEP